MTEPSGSDQGGGPVQVTVTIGGKTQMISCELLVVACDPRALLGPVMEPTTQEEDAVADLTDFTFHTTIVTATVPKNPPVYGAVLDPEAVEAMDGRVCGFRNESAKQHSLSRANGLPQNHLVVYQLRDNQKGVWTPEQFDARLRAELPSLAWWPYGSDYVLQGASLTTTYFTHFTAAGLQAGKPWQLLDLQGDNRTVYVHASTCFESVLQCWQYQQLLLGPMDPTDPKGPRRLELPPDTDASIVIVGAGVSGLLFANELRARGYTNVVLLEKQDQHVGGKTDTVVLREPFPPNHPEPTVCELGTCYLSPGYHALADALRPFTEDKGGIDVNERRGFETAPGVHGDFRGMVVHPGDTADQVVSYDDYVVARALQPFGFEPPFTWEETDGALALIAALLKLYAFWAGREMTQVLPMPTKPPDIAKGDVTYLEWIDSHGLQSLIGVLEYAYSIQGYGPLSQIPAYYGLVWISSDLTPRLVDDALKRKPEVTFWSKGWGDVWDRMSEGMTIHQGALVQSIKRPGVNPA